MIKIILATATVILITFFLSRIVFAQENYRSSDTVTVEANEVINNDFFASGSNVTILGTINGDAYIAGGTVLVDGTINGDLLVAGGDVTIRGTVNEDLRGVGGNIKILSQVSQNASLVGGSVQLQNPARINGNFSTAGGNADIQGFIGQNLSATVGNLIIGNTIQGDVFAQSENVKLKPQARIGGNFTYWSSQKAQIPAGAIVSGTIIQNLPSTKPQDVGRGIQEAFERARFGASLVDILNLLLLGLLLLYLFPTFVQNAKDIILKNPLKSFLFGFLFLILIPILGIILSITIIGIPIGILLFIVYGVLIYLSRIFAIYALGNLLISLIKQKYKRGWIYLVGVIIYAIISFLPFIGALVGFLTILFGLGGVILAAHNLYSTAQSKNRI